MKYSLILVLQTKGETDYSVRNVDLYWRICELFQNIGLIQYVV
jgi:hypothetical protein